MAINRIPYRSSLRVLGRLLNDDQACMVTISEIEHGFLMYYFRGRDRHRAVSRVIALAEVQDLDDEFRSNRAGSPGLLRNMLRPRKGKYQHALPLFPMGYEDGLRTIGASIDRRAATAVTVAELDDRLHVEYTIDRANFVLREGHRQVLAGRRQESFTAAQLEEAVYRSRSEATARVSKNGRLLQDNPLDVSAYVESAAILEEYGQITEAESLYRRVLEVAPNHPEVHYHLARYARWRGNYKAAIKHLHSALSYNGGDGPTYHLLGRTLLDRHRVEVAAEALERAISFEPENRLYQFHLELARQRLGDRKNRPSADIVAASQESAASSSPGALVLLQHIEIPAIGPEMPVEQPRSDVPDQDPLRAGQPEMPVNISDLPLEMQPYQSRRGSSKSRSRSAIYISEPSPALDLAPAEPFDAAGVPGNGLPRTAHVQPWSSPPATSDVAAEFQPLPALPESSAAPNSVQKAVDVIRRIEQRAEGSTDLLQSVSQQAKSGLPAAALPPRKRTTLPPSVPSADAGDGHLYRVAIERTPGPPSVPSLDPVLPPHVEVQALGRRQLPAADASTPPLVAQPQADAQIRADVQRFAGLIERAESLAAQPPEADPVSEAIARVEQMIAVEPQRADLHRKLGFLLAKQGRNKDAAAAFRRAVECGRQRRTG